MGKDGVLLNSYVFCEINNRHAANMFLGGLESNETRYPSRIP